VKIRNEKLNGVDQLPDWVERYGLWREQTLKAAATLSAVLHDRLETLNEVHGIPANVFIINPEHGRYVAIISEILRRIDKYLEEHEQ
jgi:hypothetical protein